MKKFMLLLSILIIYLGIKIYINDAGSVKSLYTVTVENYKLKKEIAKNKQKLEKLKNITKKQKKEKEINKKLKEFLIQRYKFKYNDYKTNNIRVMKVKDKNNIYYIKVEINFSVKKITTLLTVIKIFYRELFIEKIEVVNKNKMILYLNKNKIVFSKKYTEFKFQENYN